MTTLAEVKEYLDSNYIRSRIEHKGGRLFDLYVFAVDALKQSADGSLLPKKFRLYCDGLGDDAECHWDYTARPDLVRPEQEPIPVPEKPFGEQANEFLTAKMDSNEIMFGTIGTVLESANKATATIITANKTTKQAVLTKGKDGKFELDYYSDTAATAEPIAEPVKTPVLGT